MPAHVSYSSIKFHLRTLLIFAHVHLFLDILLKHLNLLTVVECLYNLVSMTLVYNDLMCYYCFLQLYYKLSLCKELTCSFAPAWASTVLGHKIYTKCIPADYLIVGICKNKKDHKFYD